MRSIASANRGATCSTVSLSACNRYTYRDSIQQYDFLEGAVLDALDRRAGQYAVCSAGNDFRCAAFFHYGLRTVAQGAGGIDHIVYQDDFFSTDVADNVDNFRDIGFLPAFVHNSERASHAGGKGARPRDGTEIRGNDDISSIFRRFVNAVFK